MSKSSLKEKIEKAIAEEGTLTSEDVGQALQSERAAAPEGNKSPEEVFAETTKVKADEVDIDPLSQAAEDAPNSSDEMTKMASIYGEKLGKGFGFGLLEHEDIEVTPEDKEEFINAITAIDDRKSFFKRSFSLYDGKLTGVFRSRAVEESEAILHEINREWMTRDIKLPIEYSFMLRKAMLRFQLVELNGVIQEPVTGVLKATATVKDGKKVTTPPEWMSTLEVFYGGMNEGVMEAVFRELMQFERIYWTLNNHASDQNFWEPEESITE